MSDAREMAEKLKLKPWLLRPDKYFVSECGKVYTKLRGKEELMELKVLYTGDGYRCVYPFFNGKPTQRRVHRMVLEAWVGLCPEGMQTAHLNGIKTDNRLSNLAWVTPKENMSHQKIHGTNTINRARIGEHNYAAVLTEAEVLQIRMLNKEQGFGPSFLSRKFGVSIGAVDHIIHRRTWRHI